MTKTTTAISLSIAIVMLLPGDALAENTSGVPIPSTPSFDGNATARGLAIARHADAYDRGWIDSYLQARMTLYDARGGTVQREIRTMAREGNDGDKSLLRFMTPADIRGVAALVHENPRATDDTWLYLPATRRVRRISGANQTASFQGTEFTYEDLSGLDYRNYEWRFLRETTVSVDGSSTGVYELEARPDYDDTGYSKLVVSFDRDDFRVTRTVFFDRAGERLKTLTASRWREYHGRFHRALRLDMQNHQTGKRTVIDATSQFVNLSLYQRRDGTARNNLSDAQFTRRALEGG